VHSQQRFHYMSHTGEVVVDQAHRGYTVCTDAGGFGSVNPLYMAYVPGPDGNFNGIFLHRMIVAYLDIVI
jgi:D-galacturonate reductase